MTNNRKYQRIISGVAALPAFALAIYLSRLIVYWGVDVFTLSWALSPVMIAILLLWYAFRGNIPRERQIIKSIWTWGLITSVVGFVLGFIVVPLVAVFLAGKDQPQAPLLGIFITGPAGFLIGVIIGFLIQMWRHKRNGIESESSNENG